MQYNITYREKDGGLQYIISYKDINGKWKQKSKQGFKGKGEAKKAAQSAVKDLEKKLELQGKINEEYSGMTFKEYFEMFIKHEKLYKTPNTIAINTCSFNAFPSLHNMNMEEISNINIQASIDTLITRGVKTSSIKVYFTGIRKMFNAAVNQYKIILSNPTQSIKLPKDKTTTEKRALTSTETADLLNKIKNRKYYLISLIAAKCGLRLGEILGLTWDDIIEKKSLITVNKQWKRASTGSYDFGTVKSKNSNRTVPMPSVVLSQLKKYKKQFPVNIDNRLFNQRVISSISKELSDAYKKCGYAITIHELRHTYATTLIKNGVDFKTVAKLMGHDVEETMKTYSHVTDEMLDNVSKVINNIF